MRTTIVISFALAVATTMAQAQTTTMTCSRSLLGSVSCTQTTEQPSRGVAPSKMTSQEQAELDSRLAKWEAYCKPKVVQDRDGVERYRYARAGCEFGKYQP